MATTLNAATFMGKNFSTMQSVVKNLDDLTLKQMFDVTAQLVNEQDEINGLDKILWGKNSWRQLSLIGDETVINFSIMRNVVKNQESLTLKQMSDVTAQIVNNEEEITGLDKILYQKNSWTQLSLINDPVIINLQSTKVYVFSDSVLCLGKVLQHPACNEAWKNRVAGVRAERNYRDCEDVSGELT